MRTQSVSLAVAAGTHSSQSIEGDQHILEPQHSVERALLMHVLLRKE